MGFVSAALPVLQVLSLIIGIAVGIMTFIYYWKKAKSEEVLAAAVVAAAAVKATATIAATALHEK
jgi:hypothetical protein